MNSDALDGWANHAAWDSTVAPRVAVLLAAFNGVPYLKELLASIVAQQGVLVTIYASIDESTDGTEAMIRQWAEKDARVVVLPSSGRFGSAAANFLRLVREVDFSNFDLVSFADQDDVWLPDKLQRAHRMLDQNGSDAYSSNVLAFWPNGRRRLIDKAQPQRAWDFLFEGGGPGCTFVMTRSLVLDLQVFVRTREHELTALHHHDWLIYAFVRARGRRWTMDARPGVLYRQHGGNQVGANLGWRAFLARARFVLGGAGTEQAVLLARILDLDRSAFVLRLSSPGRAKYLYLACHARQCRRRGRDQLYFGAACLCLALMGDGT